VVGHVGQSDHRITSLWPKNEGIVVVPQVDDGFPDNSKDYRHYLELNSRGFRPKNTRDREVGNTSTRRKYANTSDATRRITLYNGPQILDR